ncbi:sulfite exporter TauE/SafE family protein [Bordetella sp. 2513F-2]
MIPLSTLLLGSCIVLVAGIARGLTGFGFALFAVMGLVFLLPVREAVPVVLCLEVLASLLLAPGAWRQVEWPVARPLLLAALCGVPVGLLGLTRIDGYWMTLAVYLLIGTLAVLALARVRPPLPRGPGAAWAVGGVTGALLAAFSIGGPLVVAWMAHAGVRPAPLRATLIVFFGVIDAAALAGLLAAGQIGPDTLLRVALLVPATILGLWLGQQLFNRVPASRAQSCTQWLLLVLSLLGLYTSLRA